VLVGRLTRWRTADLLPLAVMGGWGAMACWHLRAVSDATLLTSPLVAAGLSSNLVAAGANGPVWVGTALLIALALLAGLARGS